MTTHLGNNRTGVARYLQLAMLFQGRIETGQWPVEKQIPTIDQLAADCNVARATVRQALDILEDRKLIARYRAKGTFVIMRPQKELWCEVATDWPGMLMDREGLTIEVLSTEDGQHPQEIQHHGGKLAPSYKLLRRRHWRGDLPYYLGEVYIDERLCRRIPAAAFETKSAMKMIRGIRGLEIKEARQTLTIGLADPEAAERLWLSTHAPVAYVYRSIMDRKGNLVLVTHGTYRADVVRLEMRLK